MIHHYLTDLAHNSMVMAVALCVVLDTILGCFRAIIQHSFNSSFGINGAIRKTAMLISILFLFLTDSLVGINFLGFLPSELREAISLTRIGLGDFFCILYVLYEAVSILKNWHIIGLPVPKWAKPKLEKLLSEMTDEISGEGDKK